MSKNLTRKGLAFGALFALGTSVIAGAPAQAAQELYLEPTTGTEYTMIQDEAFSLKAYGNNEFIASNGSQIRFLLENKTAASFTGFSINETTLDNDYNAGNGNMIKFSGINPVSGDEAAVGEGTVAAIGTAAGDKAVLGLGASVADFDATSTSAMTTPSTLSFTNTAVTAETPESVYVTAFVDSNNNGAIDAGELKSATRTVTFINEADVTPSISGGVFAGETDLSVSFTLGDVNEAQLTASEVGVNIFANDGTTTADASEDIGTGNFTVALNSAKTAFTRTITPDTAPTTASASNWKAFKVQALYENDADNAPEVDDTLGTSVTTITVSARTLDATNTTADVVASANAKVTTASSAADVRKNSEFVTRITVKDATGTSGAALPGVSTTATVATSLATLSDSVYVIINGTSYKTKAALAAASVVLTTDSKGQASVTLNTVGFAAADYLDVTFTTQGSTDTVRATARTASYSHVILEGSEAADEGYDASIAIGGKYTVNYIVADQFGVVPADGGYTISVARSVSTARATTAASWTYSAAVIGGKASITITDNGAGAGADTITSTLYGADASATTEAFVLTYTTAAAADAASITLVDNQDADDSVIRLDTDALASWNYYANGSKDAPLADANNFKNGATTGASDTLLQLSGVVANASSVGIEGVLVTVAATGITFKYTDGAGKEIYSRDKIVVPTSAGGTYVVNAYSDGKGGSVVFTATTGALSKTTTVTFDQGIATGLAITAPTTSAAGRVVDVTVKITDASNQAVSGIAVTLKSTGVGYLNSASGTSDASGEVVSKLIVGVNETGSATVSATATIDGVVTTKTVTITVAAPAVAPTSANASASTGKINVAVTAAAGKTVVVKVGGKFATSFSATGAKKTVSVKSAKGAKTVTIYVGGKLVKTVKVTVK